MFSVCLVLTILPARRIQSSVDGIIESANGNEMDRFKKYLKRRHDRIHLFHKFRKALVNSVYMPELGFAGEPDTTWKVKKRQQPWQEEAVRQRKVDGNEI